MTIAKARLLRLCLLWLGWIAFVVLAVQQFSPPNDLFAQTGYTFALTWPFVLAVAAKKGSTK